MNYLIFSICASVIVSVLLKIMRRFQINVSVAVGFNYLMAIVLSVVLLHARLSPQQLSTSAWEILIPLGILLPSVFIIMGKAVDTSGIVLSDGAQRLSLFLSLIAAFVLFGEQPTPQKLTSLVIALIALFLLIYKHGTSSGNTTHRWGMLWLLLVWLGYGVIDILFKKLSGTGASFTTNLLASFSLAFIFMILYFILKRIKIRLLDVGMGLVLGAFNFGNIYFYLRAHQVYSTSPTLVFASMNIGVVALGTLIGGLVFKEAINRYNLLGIVLAIVAIFLFNYHLF